MAQPKQEDREYVWDDMFAEHRQSCSTDSQNRYYQLKYLWSRKICQFTLRQARMRGGVK